MKLTITGKNIHIGAEREKNLTTKLSRLEKYFNEDATVKAVVSKTKNLEKIEVTIPLENGFIRAEAEEDDLYNATDLAVDKLARQLRKNKEKLIRKGHDTIRYENVESVAVSEDNQEPKIVRRKKFGYKPMSEEEAVLQMEMLGHNFFIFTRDIDDSVCLIYTRSDGDYGIIEQE